jgi:hypothetical protein
MTRLKEDPGEENNPIVQYQEWAENRYNSGHWLGGLYVGTCVLGAAYAFYYARNTDDLIMVLLMLLVYFIPGMIMLFARDQKRRRRRASQAHAASVGGEQEHQAHRHGHGRYSDR